jgi:hypothetical protein
MPRSSTSARRSTWRTRRRGAVARRPTPRPKCSKGASPRRARTFAELLEAKRILVQKLHERLPREVVCNELLMNLIRSLVAPDPTLRFPSAEAADLLKEGAANFHRQLIKGDLASEYENEIRLWLGELD